MTAFDLAIVGGGINGVSIARDAAGRGLRVLLVEKDDLAAHTSSASSKLIHGGLRYLEHREFRLVAEALAEREVMLTIAPHLVRPMTFVLPHEPHLRPRWMIRAGLFLYDHIGGRSTLPRSRGVNLRETAWGRALKPEFRHGFTYADAAVDDARLAILTARDAADRGATILVRTECREARRAGAGWRLVLRDRDGAARDAEARVLVNAAGPWTQHVVDGVARLKPAGSLRLVKGSHVAVPRLYTGDHAYILQNPDQRVIFLLPYGNGLTAIGTTDVPVDTPEARISTEEIAYLCTAASRYTAQPVTPAHVVNSWSGVRALYDDGAADASAVTRDYHLLLDEAGAPLLSVYGGKITTARRLAEAVLDRLAGSFPGLAAAWTHRRPLPGGDFDGRAYDAAEQACLRRYPEIDPRVVRALFRRHGTGVAAVLDGVRTTGDLGTHFGGGLYEREVFHCVTREWASTVDDLVWRRTKAGLEMTADECTALGAWLAARRSLVV